MARPSVVLPEPDSPTTPTVSPSRTTSETPSTAFTWPTVRRRKPRLIGNQTLTSSAVRHGRRGEIGRRRLALRLGGEQHLAYRVLRIGEHLARPARPRRCARAASPRRSSAILRTMPRSWVMNSIAMPCLACRSFSSSRICACTVTSSAVVGSSAMNRSGRLASAMAIITRWRWPPEKLMRIGAEPRGRIDDADLCRAVR